MKSEKGPISQSTLIFFFQNGTMKRSELVSEYSVYQGASVHLSHQTSNANVLNFSLFIEVVQSPNENIFIENYTKLTKINKFMYLFVHIKRHPN